MKPLFIHRFLCYGVLLTTITLTNSVRVWAQAAKAADGLYATHSINAGGEFQKHTGPPGGNWSLLFSIGEPIVGIHVSNSGNDITWTGFPVILPIIGLPGGVREEHTVDGAERNALRAEGPNPFSGAARLRFTLQSAAVVRLTVYDMTGRQRGVLASGRREPGGTLLEWVPEADLEAGAYFVRLTADGHDVQTIILHYIK